MKNLEKQEFKLGPLQKKWIRALKKYPHAQLKCSLGEIQKDGTYKACCLGELALTCKSILKVQWKENHLFQGKETGYISNYRVLGLRSKGGQLKNPLKRGKKVYTSLADMNDNGLTWTQIAEEVVKNPSNFFTKSF